MNYLYEGEFIVKVKDYLSENITPPNGMSLKEFLDYAASKTADNLLKILEDELLVDNIEVELIHAEYKEI